MFRVPDNIGSITDNEALVVVLVGMLVGGSIVIRCGKGGEGLSLLQRLLLLFISSPPCVLATKCEL